jgi:hypothetical protein
VDVLPKGQVDAFPERRRFHNASGRKLNRGAIFNESKPFQNQFLEVDSRIKWILSVVIKVMPKQPMFYCLWAAILNQPISQPGREGLPPNGRF